MKLQTYEKRFPSFLLDERLVHLNEWVSYGWVAKFLIVKASSDISFREPICVYCVKFVKRTVKWIFDYKLQLQEDINCVAKYENSQTNMNLHVFAHIKQKFNRHLAYIKHNFFIINRFPEWMPSSSNYVLLFVVGEAIITSEFFMLQLFTSRPPPLFISPILGGSTANKLIGFHGKYVGYMWRRRGWDGLNRCDNYVGI